MALAFGALGAFALVDHRFDVAGFVLAALTVVPVVVAFRMRLAADDSGVTIINLSRRVRIPWTEIEGFRMGWLRLSSCLDVRMTDGNRVHAWVVTTTGGGAYSQDDANALVSELRRRLALARGESPDRADARALEDALGAAERGDYEPLGELAMDDRIDPAELWRRVEELADQGRIDLHDLRRSAPPLKLSWWTKIFLSRSTRELIAAEGHEHDLPS